MKIAHIINPVKVEKESDLFYAQPITFESMLRAREFANNIVEIELFTAQFPEDQGLTPDDFHPTPDLTRSALDLGQFREQRKLPILRDILDRLYQATDAEYLIYTNVDIGLMPHFYATVYQHLANGADALNITRRTIDTPYRSASELPLIYGEIGSPHFGHDCLVFRHDAYPNFKLGDVLVGMPPVGSILLWNAMLYAHHFQEIRESHLTFHIENKRAWRDSIYQDYHDYNLVQQKEIVAQLENEFGDLQQHPVIRNHRSVPYVKPQSDN